MTTWDDYRHRRNIAWIVLLTYLPGVSIVSIAMRQWSRSEDATIVLAVAWMVAYVIAARRCSHFACPRCAQPFFMWHFTYHVFTRQCLHCNLPKWSDPGRQGIGSLDAGHTNDAMECPVCHQTIESDNDTCDQCGWSYLEQSDAHEIADSANSSGPSFPTAR
ncbi:hypothetical protein [Allorhodopirellula solitaria]|uniref:Uncharacterized protein n=1 Tax=Allorhodopirellula solitaria TaxID=2527987 RepID=A0A5C5YIR0_9BACT|nr:hypothetical protein [Allorhodopirellula solitaria]TWT74756.1 hypothetical protein CA85_00410 [Allorhodopirellula solitaria]